MYIKDVVTFFGTKAAAARALGISKPAITCWKDVIPELRARQLHEITGGKLKFRADLYRRGG